MPTLAERKQAFTRAHSLARSRLSAVVYTTIATTTTTKTYKIRRKQATAIARKRIIISLLDTY